MTENICDTGKENNNNLSTRKPSIKNLPTAYKNK